MIAFIQGTITAIHSDAIIIETHGIGYHINCANPFSFQKYQGQTYKIHTYHYVREDLIALYGFATEEEKSLFESLINVSGIGPKGALAILAACSPGDVAVAVENEDEKYLTQFPGVGKKTARQMILDLKGNLAISSTDMSAAVSPTSTANNHQQQEAVDALRALGYSEKEIQKVIKHIDTNVLSTDDVIKQALQKMVQQS